MTSSERERSFQLIEHLTGPMSWKIQHISHMKLITTIALVATTGHIWKSRLHKCVAQFVSNSWVFLIYSIMEKGKFYHGHLPLPGLEPVGGEPLMSATRGQCDVRPTVAFPAARHHRPLAGTKLCCLVTEAHVWLAQRCTWQRAGQDSNPRPVDRKSSTLPLRHRATQYSKATVEHFSQLTQKNESESESYLGERVKLTSVTLVDVSGV